MLYERLLSIEPTPASLRRKSDAKKVRDAGRRSKWRCSVNFAAQKAPVRPADGMLHRDSDTETTAIAGRAISGTILPAIKAFQPYMSKETNRQVIVDGRGSRSMRPSVRSSHAFAQDRASRE